MSPALFDKKETVGIQGGSDRAIVLHCEQQGAVWHTARLGIVTASMAKCVVTSKGEPCKGKTRETYMHSLIGEQVARTVEMNHNSAAMERGTELQGPARQWYAYVHRPVYEVGFVYYNQDRLWGCSPDGLCDDRAIEIKCLMRKAHVGYLLKGKVPTEFIVQCQFVLYVTGLPCLDFCLWTDEPLIADAVWPVLPDEKLHDAFAEYVPKFMTEVIDGAAKIKGLQ